MKQGFCLLVLLAFGSLTLAQKADQTSALESLVNTERAFAKASEDKGTRDAFMAFIADDGILFRPTAVKGKQWMTEHPLPRAEKRDLLSWQPAFADISAAADMGYTTGPWQYKTDINDGQPVAFGDFITVWKRQADGSWRFAVDLGISHPQPTETAAPWQLPSAYKVRPANTSRPASLPRDLLDRDREFLTAVTTKGAQRAFNSFAAKDARMFREGKLPLVGARTASAALPEAAGVWSWEPAFADVSRSDDLGYTYGTYRLTDGVSGANKTETGNYLRIWKKQSGTWKVVVDVANPLPRERN